MQRVAELTKRLFRYYLIDILLAVVFLIVAFVFVYDQPTLLSAIARKISLASAGLVYYYVSRYAKIGVVDWEHPYDKIYSLALLLYVGIVFALG